MDKRNRLLPNGTYSTSDGVYLDYWTDIIQQLEDEFDLIVTKFDPDFYCRHIDDDEFNPKIFTLDRATVMTLLAFISDHE